MIQDSSVSIALVHGLDVHGSVPERGKRFCSTVFSPALGPTKPPLQWLLRAFSLGLKWQGSEADRSPPASAEVRNGGAIRPLPICDYDVVLN
jgi:hypothetical protein